MISRRFVSKTQALAIDESGCQDLCPGVQQPEAPNFAAASEYLYNLILHDDANPLRWKLFYFWHDRLATAVRGFNNDGRRAWPLRHLHLLADNVLMNDYRQFLKDFTIDEVELFWLNGAQNRRVVSTPPVNCRNLRFISMTWENLPAASKSGVRIFLRSSRWRINGRVRSTSGMWSSA